MAFLAAGIMRSRRKMMRGVLYHSLHGELAWSGLCATSRKAVDVSRVSDIYCRSRLFMLHQRHLPFELELLVELKRPKQTFPFMPSVTYRGQLGMALSRAYDFDEWITFRYPSEHEARLDLEAIISKQRQLMAIARRLS
jgi:hypothetical protein